MKIAEQRASRAFRSSSPGSRSTCSSARSPATLGPTSNGASSSRSFGGRWKYGRILAEAHGSIDELEALMLTILFHMTIKSGLEEKCSALAKDLTASTRAEDKGCLNYSFFRRSDNPRELVLFEQWQDAESLTAHIARLQQLFGPPDHEAPVPPTHPRRRLPKAFMDLFDRTEAVRYEAIE
jgi:quinol monooxygenase YgiN